MQAPLLTLYNRLDIAAGKGGVSPERVAAFNTEAAAFGYTFDAKILKALTRQSDAGFARLRTDILALLREVSGAAAPSATLFKNFPYHTEGQGDQLFRKIIGHLQQELRVNIADGTLLSCGHIIDPSLFDLEEYGACPICEQQVDDLDGETAPVFAFKNVTALKVLSLADGAFRNAAASALIARPGSLSADERALLLSWRGVALPALPAEVTRESLPLVAAFHGVGAVAPYLKGAGDVLRLAAFLSDETADLSLSKSTRFKIGRSTAKKLLALLENVAAAEVDMLRHREAFLRLGETLHTGSKDNRRRFPKTAAAFDKLRRAPGSIPSFTRDVEWALRTGAPDAGLLALLASRPGEFARRLDALLCRGDAAQIAAAFAGVADRLPTKMLLTLPKYLMRRTKDDGPRSFVIKGVVNKVHTRDETRPLLDRDAVRAVTTVMEAALAKRFAALPAWGKVYVDPELRHHVLPFNRRGDSATASPVVKGSRYKTGDQPVLRLFLHWTGDFDIDLSAILFDADFNDLDFVSYSNLRTVGAAHSGDIRKAPKGAAEFIDLDIMTLRKRGVRYVATSVISYTGEKFGAFPCFAGYMERDKMTSGAKFEPQAVGLKFDLTSGKTGHVPLVFDLDTRRVIFADVAAGDGRRAAVSHQGPKNAALLRAVVSWAETKVTLYDVLSRHADARGVRVDDPTEADTVFTLDNLDLEAVVALTA